MKNLAMLGGALLITYWGAGPVSLDERARRPLQKASAVRGGRVSEALTGASPRAAGIGHLRERAVFRVGRKRQIPVRLIR